MSDLRIQKLAQLIVEYSVQVQPGDRVVINSSTIAEPLIKELYTRIVQAGGHPLLLLSIPGNEEIIFSLC